MNFAVKCSLICLRQFLLHVCVMTGPRPLQKSVFVVGSCETVVQEIDKMVVFAKICNFVTRNFVELGGLSAFYCKQICDNNFQQSKCFDVYPIIFLMCNLSYF